DTLRNLEELRKKGGKITGLPTGFRDLDAKLSGLHNSDLILIAARPGVGKTSFALNICSHVAIKEKKTVAIFSLEMGKEQLVNRILSSAASVEHEKLKTGNLSLDDMTKISLSLRGLTSAPMFIDDTPTITVSEIRAKCRRLKLERGLALVVIDYIQLMQSSKTRAENRTQEVADISRSLKILAKELNVPVIALSQLSRAVESRADKKPMLSDLRESGAIEQDADIVLFLYKGSEDEDSNIVHLNVAKHRSGSTGVIDLVWRGEYTRFMDVDNRSY
ncbi:MAG: replicative DNA helicase, partial [Clostridiaceae bacterium]|nr:replicative DNA helicase [Clostridiaceae bacterium]